MAHDYDVMAFCADAYLRYVRSLARAIADIEQEVEEHEHSLALMGVDYAQGGGGGASADRLPDGVIRLMELRELLGAEHARCTADLAHARTLCRADECRRALWLSKVEGMTYAEVGREMGYSKRTAARMVERGKVSLYYAMPEEWRRYAIPNALPD